MKIVYSTSYINAHLLGICKALDEHSETSSFALIQNCEMSDERKQQGFEDISDKYDFLIDAKKNGEKARQAMLEADVLIFSFGDESVLKERMQQNKLTFRCSERFYKLGIWRRWVPSSYRKKKEQFLQYKDKNFYYLCMGAYVPFDLKLSGFPVEKCFQWAYFPQIIPIDWNCIEQKQQMQGKLKICWAARMVRGKHPENAVKIALKLKKKNIPFELTIMGSGPLLDEIKKAVQRNHLENEVNVLGNCPPQQTQDIMKQSQVFLFTSDYWEGWGAVLNESMGLGCIPVSSIKAGAAPILVNTSQNGFLFERLDEAVSALVQLAQSEHLRVTLAQNAYQTIDKEWNPSVAAQRLIKVSKALLEGKEPTLYQEGVMAKAVVRQPKNYIYKAF